MGQIAFVEYTTLKGTDLGLRTYSARNLVHPKRPGAARLTAARRGTRRATPLGVEHTDTPLDVFAHSRDGAHRD